MNCEICFKREVSDDSGICKVCHGVGEDTEKRMAMLNNPFPIGARILVDGEVEAIVKQFFPEGSSSYLFPHYKLDFVDGDRNVAVSMKRVGVERKG